MQSTIIFAAAIALAQAIKISQEDLMREDEIEMMEEEEERTIIGFLFEGFEFGDLWVELTDDQRESIKASVFESTLEYSGIDASDFED